MNIAQEEYDERVAIINLSQASRLPAGMQIEVSFVCALPVDASPAQVIAWVKRCLGITGSTNDMMALASNSELCATPGMRPTALAVRKAEFGE